MKLFSSNVSSMLGQFSCLPRCSVLFLFILSTDKPCHCDLTVLCASINAVYIFVLYCIACQNVDSMTL